MNRQVNKQARSFKKPEVLRKIKQGEGLLTDCGRGCFWMQNRKDFLGSKHLGGDLSCEKLASGGGGQLLGFGDSRCLPPGEEPGRGF